MPGTLYLSEPLSAISNAAITAASSSGCQRHAAAVAKAVWAARRWHGVGFFAGWIAHSERYNLFPMDEPAMDFDGVTLSPQKELVRVFYKELWDRADKRLIPRIFHADFTFRGSLGPTLVGHEQFAGYVDWVTGAFGRYTTDILVMVEEGNQVIGKTRFHGIHRKEMFGVPPTGRHVWWTGMPIFTFENSRVRDHFRARRYSWPYRQVEGIVPAAAMHSRWPKRGHPRSCCGIWTCSLGNSAPHRERAFSTHRR
jgi:hypothetical protein